MTDDHRMLVSTEWLAAHLGDAGLRILDGSWHMPATERDPRAEFEAQHIPGAQFFDIDAVAAESDLPHMAAPADVFAAAVGKLGIGDGSQIVVYDNADTRSAARVWWNFRLMGIGNVAVLDGGLAKWLAEGRPVEAGIPPEAAGQLTVDPQPELVRDAAQVARASASGSHEIIDARPPGRFRGEEPEPRAGLKSGHMPGARNVPAGRLYNGDGTMKDAAALRAEFEAAGVDLSRPVVTSCGSGITAASLFLALDRIGHEQHALYDGSWTEWGALPDVEIATGEA